MLYTLWERYSGISPRKLDGFDETQQTISHENFMVILLQLFYLIA